ncbi:alpha-tocopherol transfer protein-like isoform X2 [Stegodyphus dumicola]|uniref:alpha-tocopherol transfer protein-like isoform X2 n=1 Tax=Stegodyphus dumicola TaxID=202533 RepID=UPI0015B32CA5|nr:alpha-tocopherol transfer protein-like isoform X2 [Stegodyphus dumicola]
MVLVPFSAEGLSPEMEAIAEKDLGETPSVRKDSLERLKKLIAAEPDFYPFMDDQFLLSFLRHQKHKVPKAFNTLRNYYHFKEKYSRIFTDFLPSEHKEVMNMNCYSVLPYRDSQGRTITVCTPARLNGKKTSIDDFIAVALTVGLLGCKLDAVSICGWVIIFDAKDFSVADLFKFACVKLLLFVLNSVQDCLPYRLKAIHVVNEPEIFHAIYNTVKHALPKKIRERQN